MSGGETPRNAMVNRNHATVYFTVAPRPDLDDEPAATAYARARAYLSTVGFGPAETEGYRLFWVRGNEVGHHDILIDDHVVVGRHTACDVPLSSGSELSLRHLLITASRVASGVALRVLDLHGSIPFYTDDREARRSIVASGPIVLRLGTYLIGGLPIGPNIAHPELPETMPRAVVTHSVPPPAADAPAHAATPTELSTIGAADDDILCTKPPDIEDEPAVATTAAPPHLSRVTVVPKAAFVTDVAPTSADEIFARLTLIRDGHSASIDLQSADLERGVLIGRSERCTDFGLRRVLDGNISRVHALLLLDDGDVIAFDLCSTQGIYHDGVQVRRHRISKAGGCVSLAKTHPVMLCLHPRTDAMLHQSPDALP
ncbi:MAG: FHA domain-containing protein [Polyangiaceae bacterium]|nr:FHA domain-containing protein [Polyangiaceae bacterium]